MQLKPLVLATSLVATSSAFNLGNGCHWWLFAVICKGPAQSGTPAPAIVPPPPVSCLTCSAPPCPSSCQPGLTQAQLANGQSMCPGPGYPLYSSNGNPACCGPILQSGIAVC